MMNVLEHGWSLPGPGGFTPTGGGLPRRSESPSLKLHRRVLLRPPRSPLVRFPQRPVQPVFGRCEKCPPHSKLTVVEPPDVQYAKSGDVNIAYQVSGEGPFDLVFVPGYVTHLELHWAIPSFAPFLWTLSSFSRLIRFDKRGTGMSDRVSGAPTLETRMDDVRAVMDAVGSRKAAFYGLSEGAAMALLFAATYPERTAALVVRSAFPRRMWAPDYPWGTNRGGIRTRSRARPAGVRPAPACEGGDPLARHLPGRRGGVLSPDAALRIEPGVARGAPPNEQGDRCASRSTGRPRPDLDPARIRRHTRPARSRALHGFVHPVARVEEIPGIGHLNLGEPGTSLVASAIQRFATDVWEAGGWEDAEPERMLATVLFTDIVGSTARAVELGDRAWRELLERHHALIRRELVRFRGAELDVAGDGFFARFDGPARAVRCAYAITETMRELGLEIRAGLHTGECEIMDGKVGGIAVHIGARVAKEAQPGEILVSSTVKDLVAGSASNSSSVAQPSCTDSPAGGSSSRSSRNRWHVANDSRTH